MLRQQIRKFATAHSSPVQISTLANGIRVATNDSPGHFSALGVYLNAGSRFETKELKGYSHVMEKLAFKTTSSISGTDMMTKLDLLGGNYQCSASRETLMYQASTFNSDVENMFSLMADSIRNPAVLPEELLEAGHTINYELEDLAMKPDTLLPELLHQTAYSFHTLGSPLIKELQPTRRLVQDYMNKFVTPQRMVAAFVGVTHEEAVAMTERHFGTMSSSYPQFTPEKALYTGGELCVPSAPTYGTMPELVHMQMGFEGLQIDHEDIYTLATLQKLLGGGGSFSAGGPGKGMYSRLYTGVLNKYYYVENCVSFNHSYSDSGLFGISASVVPQAGPFVAEIIMQQLSHCVSKGRYRLTEAEISRAKNQLSSSLLMNLESKIVELEDMGKQVQQFGKKVPVQEMIEKIERVTGEDIRRVAQKVLSSKPTVVMMGDRDAFGDVQATIKRYL